MTAKLFRNSMAVAVSVMALSIALFMGVLYQYFRDQLMEELGTETWLVARGVELEGLNYLDGLETENRVTWVAADGTVPVSYTHLDVYKRQPLAAAGHAQVRGENQISGPKEHGEESKAGDENAACAHCDTS